MTTTSSSSPKERTPEPGHKPSTENPPPPSSNSVRAVFAPSSDLLTKQTSPLLHSTPPVVTKALSQAYPLILTIDHLLALLTWTNDDPWASFLVVAVWCALVSYYEILISYFGHLLVVGAISLYVYLDQQLIMERREQPTLDSIIHTLTTVVTRYNLLVSPISGLGLTLQDTSRLALTTLFVSPIYMIVALYFIKPRTVLLLSGLVLLSYHSLWFRVTRQTLWRSRSVRLLVFYFTGLDVTALRKRKNAALCAAAGNPSQSDTQSKSNISDIVPNSFIGIHQSDPSSPPRFTYVIFENQRRWLGIGWTSNLLAYERPPWSDEFLNETFPPDDFLLPSAQSSGMEWRWVDPTWRLDLTNDGALTLTGGKAKSKSTPDPSKDDGWIYYDNTWKRPMSEDSYTKYTRRRRWIRTAELVPIGEETLPVREHRSIRFED